MHNLWVSVGGVGYSPFAPGTCGSAVVAVLFLLSYLLGAPAAMILVIMAALAAIGFIVTAVYGDRAIATYGPDPGVIVSDEFCGQAITYLWLWNVANTEAFITLTIAGFLLFRFFDIVKPPPVRQLEYIKGAWGVLLDDVMAGIYANVILQIIWHFKWLACIWQ